MDVFCNYNIFYNYDLFIYLCKNYLSVNQILNFESVSLFHYKIIRNMKYFTSPLILMSDSQIKKMVKRKGRIFAYLKLSGNISPSGFNKIKNCIFLEINCTNIGNNYVKKSELIKKCNIIFTCHCIKCNGVMSPRERIVMSRMYKTGLIVNDKKTIKSLF